MQQHKTQRKPKPKTHSNQNTIYVTIPVVGNHLAGSITTHLNMPVVRQSDWEAQQIYQWLEGNLHYDTYDKLCELMFAARKEAFLDPTWKEINNYFKGILNGPTT